MKYSCHDVEKVWNVRTFYNQQAGLHQDQSDANNKQQRAERS